MNPELEAVVAFLPPAFTDPATAFADPPALREQLAAMAQQAAAAGFSPKPDDRVAKRDVTVPGTGGDPDVPVRIYEPDGWSTGGPVLLHIHGGGFVMGGLDQDNNFCERLALGGNLPIVSVDYRLAPEHPHPAPITDCWTVYQWLIAGGSGLDVDVSRIVVEGVSAGGALAAAVAQKARDEAVTPPMYQILLYPVLDDRMVTHSMRTHLGTPMWNGKASVVMWKHYLGPNPELETSPYAAPARATDLAGLAPAAITTAEFDPLRDEAIEYAQRLMQAGVPTELHVVAGGIHAFDQAAADLKISTRVRESRFAALNTFLGHPLEGLPAAGSRWIDPEIAVVVPALQEAVSPERTAHLEGLSEADAGRRLLEEMLQGAPGPVPGEQKLTIADRHIPGPAGAPDVLVRVYQPKDATGPVGCLLDIHGGAFMMGSMPMDHAANVRYASELGIAVVSVEYRLAPEHPFPAGAEDCYAALEWLSASAVELGVDPARIAVGGGSAGGALAAAVALMARDRSGPAICFQLLQIPVMDDTLSTWSAVNFVDSPIFNRPAAERMWEAYLGEGYTGRETSPYAAPARAGDLTGLPPAYVQVAELDPLRDEGIAYAQRLMQAGIATELHSFPGTFHGSGIAGHAQVSKRAAQEMVDLLGLALAEAD